MSSLPRFLEIWRTKGTRDHYLSCTSQEDLASLRLVCREFSVKAAPTLFREIKVRFRTSTFTKQSRVVSLERIGNHVKSFQFIFPHSADTFLAPLIDSETGEEVSFVYEPQTIVPKEPALRLSTPSYGSWELTDLLVKQYPPLFHAAANVPSFVRALALLPNLTHVMLTCPGQDSSQRFRRSIVDYALISMRIAIEQNRLRLLNHVSLIGIHIGALLYLNPLMGFGALPNSVRQWRKVKKLTVHLECQAPSASLARDQSKHLHSYLGLFTPSLRHLDFRWLGERHAFPMSLNTESTSSPGSSLSCQSMHRSTLKPLRFARLRRLVVNNTVADAGQIARFIARHHRAVRHTKKMKLFFDDTILRSGTWEEALEPLTQMSGSDSWKSSSEDSAVEATEEYMDVPFILNPADAIQEQQNKIWDLHVRSRSSFPYHSGISNLQRAGRRTKEILYGTEDHMRKLFNSSFLGWR